MKTLLNAVEEESGVLNFGAFTGHVFASRVNDINLGKTALHCLLTDQSDVSTCLWQKTVSAHLPSWLSGVLISAAEDISCRSHLIPIQWTLSAYQEWEQKPVLLFMLCTQIAVFHWQNLSSSPSETTITTLYLLLLYIINNNNNCHWL